MNMNFFNNYTSFLSNLKIFFCSSSKKNSIINLKISKNLYFNYNYLLKLSNNIYFQKFFLELYFYYKIINVLSSKKPFVRKIKFFSLPYLKKKKFYNFKIFIFTKSTSSEIFILFFNYIFLFKKFSKVVFSIFKLNSYFSILPANKNNMISLKLVNIHYFISFFENNFYYLLNSSVLVKITFAKNLDESYYLSTLLREKLLQN